MKNKAICLDLYDRMFFLFLAWLIILVLIPKVSANDFYNLKYIGKFLYFYTGLYPMLRAIFEYLFLTENEA